MKTLDALIRVRILVMSLCLLCNVRAASAQQLNLVPRFDRFSSVFVGDYVPRRVLELGSVVID
jgi:hypothetical protein